MVKRKTFLNGLIQSRFFSQKRAINSGSQFCYLMFNQILYYMSFRDFMFQELNATASRFVYIYRRIYRYSIYTRRKEDLGASFIMGYFSSCAFWESTGDYLFTIYFGGVVKRYVCLQRCRSKPLLSVCDSNCWRNCDFE